MVDSQLNAAIQSYKEKREEIYNELKIYFIQEKVKRRILKQTEEPIDLLFFERNAFSEEENVFESEEAELAKLLEDTGSEVSANVEISEEEAPRESLRKKGSNKLCEYLDLEADFSGEDEEENDDEGELEGLIDNDVDEGINLDHFVQERERENEEMLKKLKSKFIRKAKKKENGQLVCLNSDSNEDFPEFESFDIFKEPVKEPQEEAVKPVQSEANQFKKMKIEEGDFFNNESDAIKKLLRKDDGNKPKGYFEQRQ